MDSVRLEKTITSNDGHSNEPFSNEIRAVWGPRDKSTPTAIDSASDHKDVERATRSLSTSPFAQWLNSWLTCMDAVEAGRLCRKNKRSSNEELAYEFGRGLTEGETGPYDQKAFLRIQGMPADQATAYLNGYNIGYRSARDGLDESLNPLLIDSFKRGLK